MPRNRIAAVVAAAALVGGGAGAAVTTVFDDGSPSAATTTVVSPTSNVANAGLSVGEVAKLATKSVVEVDATTSASSSPFPGGGGRSAEGTGFVYDADGNILTNQHVVSGASAVRVKFSDGSTYKATVVGADPSTDVAVLHVDAPASKLHPLTLADSSRVSVGDGVVAIGNPFGLDGTVTSGIVSAVGREISAPDDTPIENAIQTDAAINHGNSGGPLLNLQGQVVGITSQIQSEGGGNDGVGFAVPSNTAKQIASQLIANGKVEHAFLGVTPTNASGGVGISSVKQGSAADDAGLKVGDVVTEVDGKRLTDQSQLRAIISAHKPGDTLSLTIRRDGATKTVEATLGTRS
ncbi:MAG TPA: trypsin-like peptidase domain-containing protein [Gaiellaceae bacterium]|jgi:putative serine protease PepD|nr:trypsin-like peptidase domain-containing protein [Gaiellaceae bacterium]